ncbi:hypothetical protein QFC20_004111 [Naganishia adeliensis]|uniref:Uncharacterized protein n=1 Tax=Naganishia adeliensis TaxID=92952 RepID=A0ACC2W4J5_9TREE|nr:hypothetical protein QFC20_004111 [Naganishia adeliensis]
MASSEPSIYAQLIGLGVDEPIAQEASRRFKDMDHAANWAFDHGQAFVHLVQWLSDNNAATTARFGTSTSEDFIGNGPPPQQTHNNSPNVSPLIGPQEATSMDVEDLRGVDMTGVDNELVVTKKPHSTLAQNPEGSQEPFAQGDAHHHNTTYGKKARTSFGAQGAGVQQTPVTAHRQLPPAPPVDSFNTQEFGIPGESEEDQIQRAIRMSLGEDDSPFTTVPLTHPPTQHVEDASSAVPPPAEAMDTDPPGYNESESVRRLRASAPPPEFTAEENSSGIQLGSNNPFKAAGAVSAEKSVTFSRVPDATIDHGNSSLVPVGAGGDSTSTPSQTAPRTLTAQEQEDADLQAALSASLTENAQGGFPATTSATSTAGGPSGAMEGMDELDLDPDGKTLFDEGQQNVPLKQDEAPMAISVLWDNGLYAANIIQCLMATPQFQVAVASVDLPTSSESTGPSRFVSVSARRRTFSDLAFRKAGNERLKALVDLSRFFQNSSNAYVTTLLGMNTLFDVAPSTDVSRSAITFLQQVVVSWLESDPNRTSDPALAIDPALRQQFNPLFVSKTTLLNSNETEMNAVSAYTLNYSPSSGNSITDLIAAELWLDSPNRFFASVSDVLPIVVTRGAKNVWGETKPLVFGEDLYMDRFLAKNASQVAQIRGNEGLSKKKIENIQEELQKWTTHKRIDISATLDRTLKHFERKAENTLDQAIKDQVAEIIEKLKDAGTSIATRKEELQKELEEEQQKSKDCWHQPGMNQERTTIALTLQAQYTLRGVCFYAGWIARTSMYCYVKGQSDTWWKISDTVVEPATFEQIKEDRTGLYFDSGAYLLVYARQTSDSPSAEAQEVNVDLYDQAISY